MIVVKMKISVKKQICEAIRKAGTIAISSHVRPDADSIGSGLALYAMLNQLKKRVVYINADDAPSPVNLLPGYEVIEIGQIYPRKFDLVILIEGSDEKRSGQKNLQNYFSVNIDHHATSALIASINWVEPDSAAVGEMIYQLGKCLKVDFDTQIAFNIYAAIVSDTGSFKYSNTSARSLRIAAEMVKAGKFKPFEVSDILFNSNPPEKIKMLTMVLSTMDLALNNRLLFIDFKRSFLKKFNLNEIETEDILTVARSIKDVKVVVFFKELEKNFFRVSIRSSGSFSSQKIALLYDGGGHDHAAGFFYRGSLENGKRDLISVINRELALCMD